MKTLKQITLLALILSFSNLSAQTLGENTFGKGIINTVAKDSTWSMKVGLRFQYLSIGSWDTNSNGNFDINTGDTDTRIRRSRLKFSGFAYNPKLKYKVELGLSNNDTGKADEFNNEAPKIILDAVLKWNFYKNLELWGGQTKLPGNRERVISSANLQFVDRSLLNSNFNIDRDMGFQLRNHHTIGKNFIVREQLAVSQGEGRNITTGNVGGQQYTARVELLPFGKFSGKGDYKGGDLKREKTPKLAIGASYNHNDNASRVRGSQKGIIGTTADGLIQTDIDTHFVDFMYKHNGYSVMGEYAYRTADDNTLNVQEGLAYNIQGGYLFKSNYEVAARYTQSDFVGAANTIEQYTLGLSKYIVGHALKVQTDFSYTSVDGSRDELQYRLQFDIHF